MIWNWVNKTTAVGLLMVGWGVYLVTQGDPEGTSKVLEGFGLIFGRRAISKITVN